MNVSLTPHFEQMIREQVESGRYNNASEVVREALRLLEERERNRDAVRSALTQAELNDASTSLNANGDVAGGDTASGYEAGLDADGAQARRHAWLRAQMTAAWEQIESGDYHEDSDAFWADLEQEVDQALMRGQEPSPNVCP